MKKPQKKPWPTKAAMEQIYANHLWGGNEYEFYSGEGSYLPLIVDPYLKAVSSFLSSFQNPLVVCDLGCGDFNVSKELVEHASKYIAVDVVENLINHNKEKFTNDNLEFHCLNIAEDELPNGDCAILRQVLQHLSNDEIKRVVSKLKNYRYVILTEHIPEGEFIPNIDIISGQGTRLKKKSGVDLLAPPFNLKVKNKQELLSVELGNGKGGIVTILIQCK